MEKREIPGRANSACRTGYELFGTSDAMKAYRRFQVKDKVKLVGHYMSHLRLCTPSRYKHMIVDAVDTIKHG